MKKLGRRKELYNEISPFLKASKLDIGKLAVLKVLLLVLSLTTPYLFKLIIDNVMIKKQINMLKWICMLYAIAFIISSLILTYQKVLSNKVYNKFTFDIRFRLWNTYTKMPVEFYDKHNSGDLKNRIDSDTDIFKKFIDIQIVEYAFNWVTGIATAFVLVIINWKLAIFGFTMIPLSFWMTKTLGSKLKNAWKIQRKTFGEYEGWLQGSIQGFKEIKALTLEKEQSRIFTNYWHTLSKQTFAGRMYWFGNRCFISIKDFFITKMNLYFIGALLIINGELSIGSLLIFMKYYEQLFENLGNINNNDMELNSDLPSMERVLEIINISPKTFSKENEIAEDFKGDIAFCGVSFNYTEKQIINSLSFTVRPNERLAIVGRSGCGKTTLIKLILGLYPVNEGEILIDGKNINTISPISIHKNIGVVMQDGFLFNMSVMDNLLLSKPMATEEELIKACKKAFIHDFIISLSNGYHTLIGEKGIKLSGGQKQRLAIAKVILAAPKIIIFDEATSSLDHESEKMIHQAIDNLSKDRTIIVIAHRLSSIISSDRILVIDKGEIVGEGCHGDLLHNNELYGLLFKRQYKSDIIC